jgi:hypothetical protein
MNNDYNKYIEYTYQYYKDGGKDEKKDKLFDELFNKIIENELYFNLLKNNDEFLTYLIKKYNAFDKNHLQLLCENNIFLNNDNNMKYIKLLINKIVIKRYMASYNYIANIFIYFFNNIEVIDDLFNNDIYCKIKYILKHMNDNDFNKLLYKIKDNNIFNDLLNMFIESKKSIIILDHIINENIFVDFNKSIVDIDYEYEYERIEKISGKDFNFFFFPCCYLPERP